MTNQGKRHHASPFAWKWQLQTTNFLKLSNETSQKKLLFQRDILNNISIANQQFINLCNATSIQKGSDHFVQFILHEKEEILFPEEVSHE